MYRDLIALLDRWRTNRHRKPLLLRGQRQVGKTWTLREFGRTRYDDVAYFNFESSPSLGSIFDTTKDPRRLIETLSILHGSRIEPGRTLIVFDEVQESNSALNALKYFAEETPDHHIACAGSLLGVALSRPGSFPVGKVDILNVHPMTFFEFLRACGDEALVSYLESIDTIQPLPEPIESRLYERLATYLLIGGMPEPVQAWAEDTDVTRARSAQRDILTAYELDFAKHAPPRDIARIGHVWRSIPAQLARENRRFVYGAARPGARAREYEAALHWLEATGVVTRVNAVAAPRLPLAAYDETSGFKIYGSDTGLLARQSGLDQTALSSPAALFTEFKGALTENYVLQSIIARFDTAPRYWRSSGTAEVEFLLQRGQEIHPIEVKSGLAVRSRSLKVYRDTYAPALAIRVSRRGLHYHDGLLDVPLYLTDRLDELIELVQSTHA